jgi:uncharacterized membrane protein
MAAVARPLSPRTRALILAIDRAILHFARRWLLFTNLGSLIFIGLPLLAPLLAAHGLTPLANLIFLLYRPVCHQRPERSFFLWEQQVAFCQRDTAIYATLFLAGLAFALLRRRLRPLAWPAFFALIAPMALDGFTQLFGLRESTPELRVITGTLFGIASVWLLYPHLEAGMAELAAVLEARFRRLERGGAGSREATPVASSRST